MARALNWAVATLVIGALLSDLANAQLPPFDQVPYTHAQRLVQIAPHRRLNLYCTGHGTPTVVLDSGWGGPTTSFAYVQPEISRLTQTCSYDRAGQGFSDPGPLPRDVNALVSDLHDLLFSAGIKPPLIYVGHSIAGLIGVMYADRYLDDLSGMVLIDPAFAHQGEKFGAIPGVADLAARDSAAGVFPTGKTCLQAAQQHRLPTQEDLVKQCLEHDPSFSSALISATDQAALRPDRWIDMISENESFGALPIPHANDMDSAELDKQSRLFGDLNLVVLTAGNRLKLPGLTPSQAEAWFKIWDSGHDAIASRSTRGRNLLVPGSGHYIQVEKPAVVIAAISQMISETRAAHNRSGK